MATSGLPQDQAPVWTTPPVPQHRAVGMSGGQFLTRLFFVLVTLFCLAVLTFQSVPQANTVVSYTFTVMAKAVVWAILTGVTIYVFFAQVLDTSISQLMDRFHESHNDSHAVLIKGFALGFGLLIGLTQASSLTHLVYLVLTRGVIALALSTVFTILVARGFGVYSMDHFRDWVYTNDNDSYAHLVAGVFVAMMVLASA